MNTHALDHPSLAPVTLPPPSWRDVCEPVTTAPITRTQWLARLEDHAPAAWMVAHCDAVAMARLMHLTPGEAGFYLRTYHAAPYLAPVDLPAWLVAGAPAV